MAAFAKQSGEVLPITIKKCLLLSDLPAALQRAAATWQIGDLSRWVFHNNTVYVFQDAHSTATEVKTTIFHELYRP